MGVSSLLLDNSSLSILIRLLQWTSTGLAGPMVDRLVLDENKLQTLSDGLKQIAESALHTLGRVMKRSLIAEGMELRLVTVPIGVLMVIFESRPDALPQVHIITV